MLQPPAPSDASQSAPRLTLLQSRTDEWADDASMSLLRSWVEDYLICSHQDLGRAGAVCPFTKQAAKINTVRFAISLSGADEEQSILCLVRNCFQELDQIPCKPGMEHFRTIIVGFPMCENTEGLATLARVQKRLKFYSLVRFRMIGYMFSGSDAPGLWNPNFRPLRSPMPVLAIRYLVEQDAPFAARHPLLAVPYLMKFGSTGLRRLWHQKATQ